MTKNQRTKKEDFSQCLNECANVLAGRLKGRLDMITYDVDRELWIISVNDGELYYGKTILEGLHFALKDNTV